MAKYQIVPDVIPVAPKQMARVCYDSGVSANLGNELTPTQVKHIPKVTWNADPSAFYTLCLTDAGSPGTAGPLQVCTNLQFDDLLIY